MFIKFANWLLNICKLTSKCLQTDFYTFANWLETFVKQLLAEWVVGETMDICTAMLTKLNIYVLQLKCCGNEKPTDWLPYALKHYGQYPHSCCPPATLICTQFNAYDKVRTSNKLFPFCPSTVKFWSPSTFQQPPRK